jgi:hypothetical protein
VLSQIDFYPLSQFDGKMKITNWSKLPVLPAPKSEAKWVNPETFFDELPAVMKQVRPLPGEEALYNWIGSVLEAAAKDPKIKQTLKETAVAAERELIEPFYVWSNNGRPAGNGWTSPVDAAEFGTDYLSRTATAESGIYDNKPEETKYIFTDNDRDGRQLDGRNSARSPSPRANCLRSKASGLLLCMTNTTSSTQTLLNVTRWAPRTRPSSTTQTVP